MLWLAAPPRDAGALDRWCRGVGPPLVLSIDRARAAPPLEELVVLTWNAHLAEGQLAALVADLRAGRFTGGRAVAHFVLLLQELYRRGPDVPEFAAGARSAFAIAARDPRTPDARDHAAALGASIVYVPSMRNGAGLREDRGNAIVTSEPVHELWAMELPLERQRRVALGAAIDVAVNGETARLEIVDAHLEPLSAPSSLWIFRNPRPLQAGAILQAIRRARVDARASIGTVLGGDFNTIQGGADEDTYLDLRAWSQSLAREDARTTHPLGRLDYLFARLAPGWLLSTTRIEAKYGSDHHPVMGRFNR
jgi:endonuclease/exonuclease/phosphatase family metal-dependent hydrolase